MLHFRMSANTNQGKMGVKGDVAGNTSFVQQQGVIFRQVFMQF